jgi:spore maturation protein CgeB
MGSVLCRQPSPIEIPDDFEDGVNCVEFNTVDELKDKIEYYLKHPTVYNTMREKSLEHFKKFHTTEARARYMLEKIGIGTDE